MRTSSHTPEQISKILEQADKGACRVAAICREDGIAANTCYRWRKTSGGMAVHEARRLKDLEQEHARLTRLLAERMLEHDLLKELIQKKA